MQVSLLGLRNLLRQLFLNLLQFFLENLIVDCRLFAPRFALRIGLCGVGGYFTSVHNFEAVGLPFQFGA